MEPSNVKGDNIYQVELDFKGNRWSLLSLFLSHIRWGGLRPYLVPIRTVKVWRTHAFYHVNGGGS